MAAASSGGSFLGKVTKYALLFAGLLFLLAWIASMAGNTRAANELSGLIAILIVLAIGLVILKSKLGGGGGH